MVQSDLPVTAMPGGVSDYSRDLDVDTAIDEDVEVARCQVDASPVRQRMVEVALPPGVQAPLALGHQQSFDADAFYYYSGFSDQLLNLNWTDIDMRSEMIKWTNVVKVSGARAD